MSIRDALRGLATKAEDQAGHIRTEQDTKGVLVVPFIRDVLGFDTEDARQVLSEYTADFRNRKLEKVDYAVFANPNLEDEQRNPVLVIEAKRVGVPLNDAAHDQLSSYFFATSSAPIGIYTNGVEYLFFSDLDSQNRMDSEPFLTLDLRRLDESSVADLVSLVEGGFDSSQLRETAKRIRIRERVASELRNLLQEVPDELVRLVMKRVGETSRSRQNQLKFKDYVQAAIAELLQEETAPLPEKRNISPVRQLATGWTLLGTIQPSQDNRPSEFRLPDGSVRKVRNWRDLLLSLFEWLYLDKKLFLDDLPLRTSRGALIAGRDQSGMRDGKQANTAPFYVELNMNGPTIGRTISQIVEKYRLDPNSMQVRLPE